jgi:hypothetical protein
MHACPYYSKGTSFDFTYPIIYNASEIVERKKVAYKMVGPSFFGIGIGKNQCTTFLLLTKVGRQPTHLSYKLSIGSDGHPITDHITYIIL